MDHNARFDVAVVPSPTYIYIDEAVSRATAKTCKEGIGRVAVKPLGSTQKDIHLLHSCRTFSIPISP
jgi:hypothetical protein